MRRHVVILNLHGIGKPKRQLSSGEERVWLDESQFQEVLDLAANRDDIEMTFDDANESDFTLALPSLQARGLKARFFVVVDRVDRPGYLSRAQIAALQAAGMEIGSHGMKHRPWAGLGEPELQEELVEARNRLEQMTGTEIVRAACPFGSYNRRVVCGLREAGFETVYTSDGGSACVSSFLQPRNSIYRSSHLQPVKALLLESPNYGRKLWRGTRLFLKRWR